jgi:hypothetical protein
MTDMTKHLWLGAAIAVVSLITLALGLLAAGAGPGEAPAGGGSLALKARVIPADRALGPVQAQLAMPTEGGTNPFTLRPSGEHKTARLPLPPPPTLVLPPLPVLPLTER